MIEYAFANLKPGVGKTTSSVFLASAFAAAGFEVYLYDCDPAQSTLRWSDMIAERSPDGRGFPFHLLGAASPEMVKRADDHGSARAVRIFDAPQMEDHARIVRAVLRRVDRVLIPTAPNGVEIDRMSTIRREIEEVDSLRTAPVAVSVLLNRVVSSASSGDRWTRTLTAIGYEVLGTRVPAKQLYSQAFGRPITRLEAFAVLAEELARIDRLEELAGDSRIATEIGAAAW